MNENKLRDVGLSWAKIRSVKDLSDKIICGIVEIDKLASLDDEKIREE